MSDVKATDADRKAAEEFLDLYIHDKVAFEQDTLAAAFARRAAEARREERNRCRRIVTEFALRFPGSTVVLRALNEELESEGA